MIPALLASIATLALPAPPLTDPAQPPSPATVTRAAAQAATRPPARPAPQQATPLDAAAAAALVEPYREDVERLVALSLSEGKAYTELVDLCTTAPRRLTGSPGFAAAVEWSRQHMRRAGLQDVRLEEVTATHWDRGDVGTVTLVEPPEFAGEELPMLALGGSVGTPPLGLTAEVLVVDGLAGADALGERARGRIILFNGPMDRARVNSFSAYGDAVGQRSRGAHHAARVGAVAALVRSMGTEIDDTPHTGGMRYPDDVTPIPTAAISTAAAERVAALVAAGRKVVVHFEQDCGTVGTVDTFNVVGDLPGREVPEEIVLVGGHLDAWDVGQGAHDDGAGCCHATEAVRLIQAAGLEPRRTLRVVHYANEENGLAGGRAYRDAHADELADHVMALESDSGGFTPRGFNTNANAEARLILQAVADLLHDAGASRLYDGGGGADISPMRGDGVVLVGYRPDNQRYFDLHHTHRDTLAEVSPRELNLGAGVIAAMLYVVADLERRLPANPVTAGR